MARHLNPILIAVLSLTLLGLCLNFSSSNAATANLTVQVRTQLSEVPIKGASVIINGPSSHSGTTDVNGIVYFSNIPAGNYSIIVSVESYPNSAPQMIAVGGDTTALVLYSYTKAYFTYSPLHPYTNDTVAFDGSLSTGSSPITEYNWDFGDGTYGTGKTTAHHYKKAGSYTASLTIHTEVGAAIYTQLIQIGSEDSGIPATWAVILFPLFLPLILFWKRKRYYVIIQARTTPCTKNPHCPGDDTKCEDCKVTPC